MDHQQSVSPATRLEMAQQRTMNGHGLLLPWSGPHDPGDVSSPLQLNEDGLLSLSVSQLGDLTPPGQQQLFRDTKCIPEQVFWQPLPYMNDVVLSSSAGLLHSHTPPIPSTITFELNEPTEVQFTKLLHDSTTSTARSSFGSSPAPQPLKRLRTISAPNYPFPDDLLTNQPLPMNTPPGMIANATASVNVMQQQFPQAPEVLMGDACGRPRKPYLKQANKSRVQREALKHLREAAAGSDEDLKALLRDLLHRIDPEYREILDLGRSFQERIQRAFTAVKKRPKDQHRNILAVLLTEGLSCRQAESLTGISKTQLSRARRLELSHPAQSQFPKNIGAVLGQKAEGSESEEDEQFFNFEEEPSSTKEGPVSEDKGELYEEGTDEEDNENSNDLFSQGRGTAEEEQTAHNPQRRPPRGRRRRD